MNKNADSFMKGTHYEFLDLYLQDVLDLLGIENEVAKGLMVAHGDKTRQYKELWQEHGVPYNEGALIYMLSHVNPFYKEVRETQNGFVAPWKWVVDNYSRFKPSIDAAISLHKKEEEHE